MKRFPMDDSAAPLYVRLKEAVGRFMSAEFSVGDLLPSEARLIQEYGVSRTTVRLALGALANEGLIIRKQGKGSFVAQPKKDVPYIGTLRDGAELYGRLLTTALVSFDSVIPVPRIAQLLDITEGAHVHKIRRVRLVEGEPVCYQVHYLPQKDFPEVSQADVEDGTFDELVAELLANDESADESVEALLADPYRASLLDVDPGSPLLLVQRVLYDPRTDRPIELTRSFYCGHSVRLQLGSHSAPEGAAFGVALGTQQMGGISYD